MFFCLGLHSASSCAVLEMLVDSSLDSAELCANEAVPRQGGLKCRSHLKHEDLYALVLIKQPK